MAAHTAGSCPSTGNSCVRKEPRQNVVIFHEGKPDAFLSISALCTSLGLSQGALHGPGPSAFASPPSADTITRLRNGSPEHKPPRKIKCIKIYNFESNLESFRYHVLYVEPQEWYPSYLREQPGVYVADIHVPLLEGRDLSRIFNQMFPEGDT